MQSDLLPNYQKACSRLRRFRKTNVLVHLNKLGEDHVPLAFLKMAKVVCLSFNIMPETSPFKFIEEDSEERSFFVQFSQWEKECLKACWPVARELICEGKLIAENAMPVLLDYSVQKQLGEVFEKFN